MGRFVTAWYARISLHNGVVENYAAGQGPIIHYRRRENDFITLPTDNAPLGVMIDDLTSDTTVINMHHGDILIALTDGYYESEDTNGQQYQEQPVIDLVRKHRDERNGAANKRGETQAKTGHVDSLQFGMSREPRQCWIRRDSASGISPVCIERRAAETGHVPLPYEIA